jgi:hypothetical protein
MPDVKRIFLCKALTVFLCFFLAFNVQFGYGRPESQDDPFKTAWESYLAKQYGAAVQTLEDLLASLEEQEGVNTLKGEAFLLLGASYEKLGYSVSAVKFYCKAKEILGEGRSIPGLDLRTLDYYTVSCVTPTGALIYVLIDQYDNGRTAYFDEDYLGARVILEGLVSEIEYLEGWEAFKGETFLIIGATYEKLNYRELAVKYYCKAKEILGEGKSIRGLELKKLKWYKVKCEGVAAVAAAAPKRRGGGFGRFLGTLLGLAVLGGVVWYLFFSPNAPLASKGSYSEVTVKVEVTYKGLNGKGDRFVHLNGVEKLNEPFAYAQDATADSTCSDATQSENRGPWTYTATDGKLTIKESWMNWDYYTRKGAGQLNRKIICTEWRISIDSYKWEKGRDPGTPILQGLDQLNMDLTSDCQAVSEWIHNCINEAVITFSAPAEFGKKSDKVYTFTTYKVETKR